MTYLIPEDERLHRISTPMPRRSATFRLLLGLMLFAVVAVVSGAGSKTMSEVRHRVIFVEDNPIKVDTDKLAHVKAAFLVNFLKFTQWPSVIFDNDESAINICLIGTSPVAKYLEKAVKTSKVHGRPVRLERMAIPLRDQFSTTELYESAIAKFRNIVSHCQLVYIAQDETTNATDLLNDSHLRSTLVIGDDAKILAMGGHLAFLIKDGHLAFTASVTNIQKTEMKVSSKLLRLAQ